MTEVDPIVADEKPPVVPVEPEKPKRNTKGQFQPRTSGKKPPEPPTDDSAKRYFDKREAELYEHLKDLTSPKELEDFDQLTRIKMMELLIKKNPNEVKKPVNPLAPTPPIEKPIPTLLDRNRRDKYMKDVIKKGSYVGFMDNLRGTKDE